MTPSTTFRPLPLMILASLVCGFLLTLPGCKPPTQQGVAQQYAALLKKVADRLDQVQSREDADRAASDIRQMLASADAIVQQARQADAAGKVDEATQQSVKQQLERITAAGQRLSAAALVTDTLAGAMQQVGYSSQSILSAAASGALPPAATPLEEAWIAIIQLQQEHAERVAKITTPAAAEQAVDDIIPFRRKLRAGLAKVAQLGGEAPPRGVPEKYRKHYDAAAARLTEKDAAVTALLGQDAVNRLAEQIDAAMSGDPEMEADPFQLSSTIRAASTKATVTLQNNKLLPGELHQQMLARLKELAGAAEAQSVIEPDGTYKLVLAPVADFGRLIQGIDFGAITDRNDEAMTFTLTIDPARFRAADSARGNPGTVGRPPFGGPVARGPQGEPAAHMQREKALFMSRIGGPQKCVTIVFQGAPNAKSPEYDALVKAVRAASGASGTASFQWNNRQELLIGPVEGFDEWTTNINFGVVTAKDAARREITLAVDATKLRAD